MKSIFDIHKRLGLNLENGLFIRKELSNSSPNSFSDLYDGNFANYHSNFKTEYSLRKLNPHSFFLFNNEPLLLFFDNPEDRKKLSQNIWNFNKSALVFVNTLTELTIYNGFNYEKTSGLLEVFNTIKTISDAQLNNYSYWKIVSAELWNEKEEKLKRNKVDKKLLDNIQATRELLIKQGLEKYANRIIGRLIFSRYLIDRKVNFDYKDSGKELLTKEGLPQLILQKENLYRFFSYLSTKFGEVFPLGDEQKFVREEHLKLLSNLFSGDYISKNQKSLFNIFDFDFIPIELVSNIYETFLGVKQDEDKAFYTPPFLVDYVLSQTVKPFVEKQRKSEEISCKTVDFTCGSGIFLCETLRTVVSQYIELANPDKSKKEFKDKIKLLLTENIFGNDSNEEAIEIAKFSLFITLLDFFENPKDIEDFEFPSLADNFYNFDVFTEDLDTIFGKNKSIQPDFIVGNPPWGNLSAKSNYIEYCKKRTIKEKRESERFVSVEAAIANKEFAQAFLLRLSDFSTPSTVCHVIVTSKLLYNLQANKFRNYFLNHFFINEVLEISSVRRQVFAKAVCPAAIIKYQYAFGNDTKDNTIDYISLKPNPYFALFKTILIEKYDYKEVIQNELIENDWLWKVLVYGHILDYRFIKRLRDKNKYPITLESLIEDTNNKNRPLFAGTGITIGNKKGSASKYKGMYFIDTNKSKRPSDLQRFYVHLSSESIWQEDYAERIRDERIFKNPPILLIKKGLSSKFNLSATISYISAMFTESLYAIVSKDNDAQLLENILGILNSILYKFFSLINGSSLGTEREQLIKKELLPFPILKEESVSVLVKELIKIKRLIEIHKHCSIGTAKIEHYQQLFNAKENELNQIIYQLYNISETEKDLIDYAQTITIPILQTKSKSYKEVCNTPDLYKPYKKVSEEEITNYITIFKEHFSKFHNGGENGYINARVFESKHILAIEFYIDKKQYENQWNRELENEKALEMLASVGFQKVSSELFIQKDSKVLKSKSFSVLKMNQYKYWHKAVARLDVLEFEESMLQSQMQSSNGKI